MRDRQTDTYTDIRDRHLHRHCHPDNYRIDICVREKRMRLSDTKRLLEFWEKASVCSLAVWAFGYGWCYGSQITAAKRKCRHPKNLIQKRTHNYKLFITKMSSHDVKTIYTMRVRYSAAGL
jgi:hypothetical protein